MGTLTELRKAFIDKYINQFNMQSLEQFEFGADLNKLIEGAKSALPQLAPVWRPITDLPALVQGKAENFGDYVCSESERILIFIKIPEGCMDAHIFEGIYQELNHGGDLSETFFIWEHGEFCAIEDESIIIGWMEIPYSSHYYMDANLIRPDSTPLSSDQVIGILQNTIYLKDQTIKHLIDGYTELAGLFAEYPASPFMDKVQDILDRTLTALETCRPE